MLLEDFVNWLLVFARVGTLLGLLPMFTRQSFPLQLRVALGGLITILLAPFLPLPALTTTTTWSLCHVLFKEVSVGLLLGFVCRMTFFGIEAAGNLVATEMGLMMSAEFNPMSNAPSQAPTAILYWMALMLWLSLDLHHWMFVALQRSYLAIPLGTAHLSEAVLQDVLHRSALVFSIAIELAAPIIGVSFVLSLVFSLLGRAVPQMNVFSESFPIRTLVGLVIFGATSLVMAQHMLNYLRRLPEDVLRVAQLLGS